jgi:hypothetical protein
MRVCGGPPPEPHPSTSSGSYPGLSLVSHPLGYVRNRLSQLIVQTNLAEMAEIKLPQRVLRLTEPADQMRRTSPIE